MALLDLPELRQSAGQVSLRLPPGRNVPLTPRVLEVVDHPAFQRLRRVRQLGPTCLVYPGAVHTRFEHSLGVYHKASQYLRRLLEVPAFADRVSRQDMLLVLAGALLHDLGHYPMAHSLEALHHKGNDTPRHEDVGAQILRGELEPWRGVRPVGDILARDWGVDPDRLARLLTSKRSDLGDKEALLLSVLSGGIDADKMDYLERDSLHMGVPYGRGYDSARLLDSLTVAEDGRSIAVTSKGRTPAEIFLFARYTMFSEAYWHHTVRSVSAMVEAAMADLQAHGALGERSGLTLDLLSRTDDEVLHWLLELSPEGSVAQRLLRGMTGQRRRLHKRVLTLSRLFEDEAQYAHCWKRLMALDSDGLRQMNEAMREGLRRRFGLDLAPGDLIIDTPPRDKDRLEDVEVAFPALAGHRRRRLTQISGVVQAISRDFLRVVKKIRVFVAPEHAQTLRQRQALTEETLLEAILTHTP
jgi:HD superfamily phosphohydrolase